MGLFDGMNEASSNNSGVYFLPGRYPRLELKRVDVIKNRKGDTCFLVEADIIESDVDERREGTSASWVANLTRHDAAMGNVKAFFEAVIAGYPEMKTVLADPNKFNGNFEKFTEYLVKAQILVGCEIALSATNTRTKAGTDFTIHRWHPVSQASASAVG